MRNTLQSKLPIHLLAPAFALVLGSCAPVGPDFVKPDPEAPEEWTQPAAEGLETGPSELVEWWRVFTSILTHGGFIHLGFNVYALWILGRRVEGLAHWAYVPIVFLISGVSGSLIGLVMPRTVVFSVGSSGGVIPSLARSDQKSAG